METGAARFSRRRGGFVMANGSLSSNTGGEEGMCRKIIEANLGTQPADTFPRDLHPRPQGRLHPG
jgi:hypothetical protein